MEQYRLTKSQQQAFNRVMWGIILVGIGIWIGSQLFAGDSGFATNLYTELLSIGVTVGILDFLAERRALRQYKEQLVRNAGSRVNVTALSAVDEMRKQGWLSVGDDEPLLKGANLAYANLQGARLEIVNFENTMLYNSDLQNALFEATSFRGAYLSYANLQNAKMLVPNFRGAHLHHANLQGVVALGAFLEDANMEGTYLNGAALIDPLMNHNTMLPDGTNWTSETDLTRFTDPTHPDFWEPDWVREQREQEQPTPSPE